MLEEIILDTWAGKAEYENLREHESALRIHNRDPQFHL